MRYYDLGGCNIYREFINNLEVEDVKIIKIPSCISVPYREIPLNQLDSIKTYDNSENLELKNFSQFILENGKVEQEYLLERYNDILNYNLKRGLANE